MADFDGDGIPNGIEYILGGDPTRRNTAHLRPTFDMGGDSDYIHLTHGISRSAREDPDLSVVVLYSMDLQTWTAATHDPEGSGITIDAAEALEGDHYLVTVSLPR